MVIEIMLCSENESKMHQYVAYYRVSTQQQGKSGLGLSAQEAAVSHFTHGQPDCMLAAFTEVETGTNKRHRPELRKAIEEAKRHDATLLIAKLDRLARNVHFVSGLMESGVKFKACDMPEADSFTVHIFAAMAEREAKLISERTRAALEAKRKRDGEWRVSNLDEDARKKAWESNRKRAQENENNRKAAGYIKILRGNGLSYQAIADKLNAEGFRTARGKRFAPTSVQRLCHRANK